MVQRTLTPSQPSVLIALSDCGNGNWNLTLLPFTSTWVCTALTGRQARWEAVADFHSELPLVQTQNFRIRREAQPRWSLQTWPSFRFAFCQPVSPHFSTSLWTAASLSQVLMPHKPVSVLPFLIGFFLFHRKTNVLRSRQCFRQCDTWIQLAEEVKGQPLSSSVVLNRPEAVAL